MQNDDAADRTVESSTPAKNRGQPKLFDQVRNLNRCSPSEIFPAASSSVNAWRNQADSKRNPTGTYSHYGGPHVWIRIATDGRLWLRVKDIDFERKQIIVREGKGDKDRCVPQRIQSPMLLGANLWTNRNLGTFLFNDSQNNLNFVLCIQIYPRGRFAWFARNVNIALGFNGIVRKLTRVNAKLSIVSK